MSLLEKITEEEKNIIPSISDIFDLENILGRNILRTGLIANIPSANITENTKKFEIQLAVPGFSKNDFRVDIEGDYLTIKAEKEEEETEENKRYTKREYNYSKFTRSFRLPETVKREDIKANYADGILKIILNKKVDSIQKTVQKIHIS